MMQSHSQEMPDPVDWKSMRALDYLETLRDHECVDDIVPCQLGYGQDGEGGLNR